MVILSRDLTNKTVTNSKTNMANKWTNFLCSKQSTANKV